MKLSIYDLAFRFFEEYYTGQDVSNEAKKAVVANLVSISKRTTSQNVLMVWGQMKRANQIIDINEIMNIPYAQGRDVEPNLLTPGRFYLHPELRVTAKPPVMSVDIDSGTIERHIEPYFLEMAYSYTVSELVSYYLSKEALIPKNFDTKRYHGAFKHLIVKYEVEVVLFMIDRAYDNVTSYDKEPLSTPLEIENFYANALTAMDACVSQAKEEGGDVLVKKERVLSR